MYTKKIIFGMITFLTLSLALYFSQGYFSQNGQTSANPDYICIKDVTDSPCEATTCEPWQLNGTRVCQGQKATSVAYYLIRTNCEAGYTKVSLGGNVGGSSGRNSPDYTYTSTGCTITEVDNIVPLGTIGEQ